MSEELREIGYELTIEGVAPEHLVVQEFAAREALFETYRVDVGAVVTEAVDVGALLGQPASLRLDLGAEGERWFHGVVYDATLAAPRRDLLYLQVTIAPRLALLALGRDSRIFQNLSVPDVVKKVLAGAVPADAVRWDLRGTYAPRENVVQFNESDYDFVTRLLDEEGIGYALENAPAGETLVLFDDNGTLHPIEGESTLWDREGSQLHTGVVIDAADAHATASDEVMLRDYDFRNPARDLSARQRAPNSTGREVYVHHGDFTEVSAGARRAERLLQRLRVGTRRIQGRSDCPRLEPGRTFTLEQHRRAALNGELLVLAVTHRGRATTPGVAAAAREGDAVDPARPVAYECSFVAIPSAVPYRPQAAAAAPVVGGVHVAFVTVPAGEEIHADENGRVKVRFPWDRSGVRDDKSSTWLRVGQLALGGSMVLPRVDFEVLADFEFGDIDRPFVTGHLYNGTLRPPYALPANKTRSSIQTATTGGGGGANELRFEDGAGGEEIFINASKDMTTSVENDSTVNIVGTSTVTIGANHDMLVGTDHSATVSGTRSLSVGANQKLDVGGNYSDGVGGALSDSVGGMRKIKCGGDHVEEVASTLSRTVGGLLCATGLAGYARTIIGSSKCTVGGVWMEMGGGSRMSAVKGSRKETIGALKFIKAKDVSITAGGAYTLCAAALSSKVGGSRTDQAKGAVAVTSGGGISVTAKGIVISATSKLVVLAGGTMIKLSSSGSVDIKAPTVDLTGVKNLSQILHKSNP